MRQKILVIEDDAVTAEMLEAALSSRGYDVRTASDGLTGCRAAADERPDLILLDALLPDLDGWEILSMIRTLPDPRLSSLPIIMVTAQAAERDRVRGLRLGADDYVTKPFSVEELLQRIANRLSRSGERGHLSPAEGPRDDLQQVLHHELKNHLVAIAGFGRRIEAKAAALDPEAIRRYAGFIRKSAEHLSSLSEEFLLLHQVEAGQWRARAKAVDMDRVVHNVVALMGPLAKDNGIELHVAVEDVPPVRFNELAGRTCVANLVENALKYTEEGGTVSVELKRCDARVCVEVADTGPGIPEAEAGRIFQKFYRGPSRARTTKGTGLGLYLVKYLAEALGASVALVDPGDGGKPPRSGARFRLVFEPMQAA